MAAKLKRVILSLLPPHRCRWCRNWASERVKMVSLMSIPPESFALENKRPAWACVSSVDVGSLWNVLSSRELFTDDQSAPWLSSLHVIAAFLENPLSRPANESSPFCSWHFCRFIIWKCRRYLQHLKKNALHSKIKYCENFDDTSAVVAMTTLLGFGGWKKKKFVSNSCSWMSHVFRFTLSIPTAVQMNEVGLVGDSSSDELGKRRRKKTSVRDERQSTNGPT